jgi:lipoyl synthase
LNQTLDKNKVHTDTKKKVIFAVPGSKVYINKHYRNKPNSFLNISLTGHNCELMCSHCKALLLKDMIDINSGNSNNNGIKSCSEEKIFGETIKSNFVQNTDSEDFYENNRIIKILEKYGSNNVKGLLISGGFDKDGKLSLDNRILSEIRQTREQFGKNIRIFLHLGFTSPEIARAVYECRVDGVLVNVFSDTCTIRKVYNLDGCTPEMFYDNVKFLKESGLIVSPHLIIGLSDKGIAGEYKSLEAISGIGVDSVVFAIAKRISKHQEFKDLKIKACDIVSLYEYARELMPHTPITLGCAKPPGPEFEEAEIELLGRGINTIAFPSEKTVDFAIKNGIDYDFIEQCCAI